jgi:hypothetical protein
MKVNPPHLTGWSMMARLERNGIEAVELGVGTPWIPPVRRG